MKPLTAMAILAVRNEISYVENTLRHLIEQGLTVHVIDNESSDGTREVIDYYRGHGVVGIEAMPFTGSFSLQAQLEAKARVAAASDADWIVHVDADEALQSPREGERLIEGIERAEAARANCINFREFVFLPVEAGYDPSGGAVQAYRDYYYFAPSPLRLLRAWKRDSGLSNVSSGGHLLKGGQAKPFAESFILRHYIFLDQEHARQKYLARSYSAEETARGWHRNRINRSADDFLFPRTGLKRLAHPASLAFDMSEPMAAHYWEWHNR